MSRVLNRIPRRAGLTLEFTSLLPGIDLLWPTAARSCYHDFPNVMDCTFERSPNEPFLPSHVVFRYFVTRQGTDTLSDSFRSCCIYLFGLCVGSYTTQFAYEGQRATCGSRFSLSTGLWPMSWTQLVGLGSKGLYPNPATVLSLNTQTTASWPRGWALKEANGNMLLFWCVNSQWAFCQLESCIAFEVISSCTESHGLGGPGTHLSRSSNLQQKSHRKNPPMAFRPGRHIILKGSLSLAFINCKLRRKPLNSTPFHE